ncbi:MAG: cation-translocating P-type ATPase [Phycisphaerales bacterium]
MVTAPPSQTSTTRPAASSNGEAGSWHMLEVAAAMSRVDVGSAGLSDDAVAQRRAKFGRNELTERGGRTIGQIIFEQVRGVMILMLVGAAILALALGKAVDGVAILAIVVLFVVLGVVQEYRAQKAIAALKQMSSPTVRVRRSGQVIELPAADLVPGDIVQIENGNVVPADLRVIESVNLRIQEAPLTGESEPVEKVTHALSDPEMPLGDRVNMAYMGTFCSFGRGVGVVVQTGMTTELGKVATMIQNVAHQATPLQKRLDKLAKMLAVVAVVIAVLVLISDVVRGVPISDGLLFAVAVAVAIVTEGLPAVLTFTLALGAQRMLKRKALIRKLPAVETLGSVTVICSDKTGTLTQNRMTVTSLDVAGTKIDVAELGRASGKTATVASSLALPRSSPGATLLLAAGQLCNDATLEVAQGSGEMTSVGDPTESALVFAAARFGLLKRDLERALPRVAELPFDSDRKRMTTVHRLGEPVRIDGLTLPAETSGAPLLALVKGAVDGLMPLITNILTPEGVRPMNEDFRRRVMASNDAMGAGGMRVLAVAYRTLSVAPRPGEQDVVEQDLTLVGLVGMIDPPRPEVRDAVATCKRAGIRPIMITGDHPLTARAIAAELGITTNDGRAVTGVELERMNSEQFREVVRTTNVFARVSPEHKLKLVEALQANGEIVAMTGDGVNDAPALKKADIGVAMGITGTDVAKEAADMVLLDDNFATIVAAVEEGRIVYDNLKRFVLFSIAGNIGKVAIVAFPPLIGLPKLLVAFQVLFSNLLTDGLLGLGMGVERGESNVMKRPPYRPDESIFSRGGGWHVAWLGSLIAVIVIGVAWWYHNELLKTARGGVFQEYAPDAEGKATIMPSTMYLQLLTMVFMVLAIIQMMRVLGIRSFVDPIWKSALSGNRTLVAMLGVAATLQALAVFFPPTQQYFSTTSAGNAGLMAVGLGLVSGVIVLVAMEIEKIIRRRGIQA